MITEFQVGFAGYSSSNARSSPYDPRGRWRALESPEFGRKIAQTKWTKGTWPFPHNPQGVYTQKSEEPLF